MKGITPETGNTIHGGLFGKYLPWNREYYIGMTIWIVGSMVDITPETGKTIQVGLLG